MLSSPPPPPAPPAVIVEAIQTTRRATKRRRRSVKDSTPNWVRPGKATLFFFLLFSPSLFSLSLSLFYSHYCCTQHYITKEANKKSHLARRDRQATAEGSTFLSGAAFRCLPTRLFFTIHILLLFPSNISTNVSFSEYVSLYNLPTIRPTPTTLYIYTISTRIKKKTCSSTCTCMTMLILVLVSSTTLCSCSITVHIWYKYTLFLSRHDYIVNTCTNNVGATRQHQHGVLGPWR